MEPEQDFERFTRQQQRDIEMLLYPSPLTPEQELYTEDLNAAIQRVLSELDSHEREVLRLRFGLDGEPMTLEEVGKLKGFKVQKERIRQIQAKALRRLRHPSRWAHLRALVNPTEHYFMPSGRTSRVDTLRELKLSSCQWRTVMKAIRDVYVKHHQTGIAKFGWEDLGMFEMRYRQGVKLDVNRQPMPWWFIRLGGREVHLESVADLVLSVLENAVRFREVRARRTAKGALWLRGTLWSFYRW